MNHAKLVIKTILGVHAIININHRPYCIKIAKNHGQAKNLPKRNYYKFEVKIITPKGSTTYERPPLLP